MRIERYNNKFVVADSYLFNRRYAGKNLSNLCWWYFPENVLINCGVDTVEEAIIILDMYNPKISKVCKKEIDLARRLTDTPEDVLLPCPFCGAGETDIIENGKLWTGMSYSKPLSYSIVHWCTPEIVGIQPVKIERKGKTKDDAINQWNKRNKGTE